jgi:hypothetical protein
MYKVAHDNKPPNRLSASFNFLYLLQYNTVKVKVKVKVKAKVKVKGTLVLALRLCTGRTALRESRGIALFCF